MFGSVSSLTWIVSNFFADPKRYLGNAYLKKNPTKWKMGQTLKVHISLKHVFFLNFSLLQWESNYQVPKPYLWLLNMLWELSLLFNIKESVEEQSPEDRENSLYEKLWNDLDKRELRDFGSIKTFMKWTPGLVFRSPIIICYQIENQS